VASEASEPHRLQLDAGTRRSGDGYDVSFTVEFAASLRDSPVDHDAFADAFADNLPLSRAMQMHRDILQRRLQQVVATLALPDAKAALDAPPAEPFAKALTSELFAIGCVASEIKVSADSKDFREAEATRAAAEAVAAAEGHAAELLTIFNDIRRKNPDVSAGKLLAGLSKDDQKPTLLKLHAGEPDAAAMLVACGTVVWRLHSGDLTEVGEDELGPIRRLASCHDSTASKLLTGTRFGMTVRTLDHLEDFDRNHLIESTLDATSGSGFARVATAPDRNGWTWHWMAGTGRGVEGVLIERSNFGVPKRRTRYEDADLDLGHIRSILPLPGSRLLVAGSNKLVLLHGEAAPPEPVDHDEPIIALLASGRQPIAVGKNGSIHRLVIDPPETSPVAVCPVRGTAFSGPVTTAAAVPWLGDVRIAAALIDGGIEVTGADDDVVLAYQSPYRGFVELSASRSHLAAVHEDRERLVVWRHDQPDQPVVDRFLTSDTRSRIADVMMLPS
jgi:hypothetical protein